MNFLQFVAALGAVGFGIWLNAIQSGMDPGSRLSLLGLLLGFGPVACILVAVTYFRAGEIFALILLAVATFWAAQKSTGEMRGAPQAIATVIMLFGAPLVFLRGLAVRLRRVFDFKKRRA